MSKSAIVKEDKEVKVVEEATSQISADDLSSKTCGFVMPIAATEGYRANHWENIQQILIGTCETLGFKETRIVSSGQDVNTIHKRIVNNLFHDDLIICDVSSRNPNVMFELGMRIAFDKPLIIIKDDDTPYCFDAGTIEHLSYPKDLRYHEIQIFIEKLKSKIMHTLYKYAKNPSESPILQSFGSFDIKKINIPEMSNEQLLLDNIGMINKRLARMENSNKESRGSYFIGKNSNKNFVYEDLPHPPDVNYTYSVARSEIAPTLQIRIRSLMDEFMIKYSMSVDENQISYHFEDFEGFEKFKEIYNKLTLNK